MATPVLIEQYTPPNPVPVPSPTPMLVEKMPEDPKAEANKPEAGKMPALAGSESMKAPEVMPKPTENSQAPTATPVPAPKPAPPARNPQMVVTELQRAALMRAVYSDRQLYEMMVTFWENHFSIFANKDDERYLLTSFDRDTIRPFAMGRFRDLLGATAHSPRCCSTSTTGARVWPAPYPAYQNQTSRRRWRLNENYARELLELHTMGVDGGYSQQDVQEVALLQRLDHSKTE